SVEHVDAEIERLSFPHWELLVQGEIDEGYRRATQRPRCRVASAVVRRLGNHHRAPGVRAGEGGEIKEPVHRALLFRQRTVLDPVREGVAARPEVEDVYAHVHQEGL